MADKITAAPEAPAMPAGMDPDAEPLVCEFCGSTEMVEIGTEFRGYEQTILICAGCGAD